MMKKYLSVFLILCFALVSSGCTSTFLSIDGLIMAPKLNEEQTQIYHALIDSVGKDIKLKYPKNGEERSPFVLRDIDNDGQDEAIVFYETVSKTTENLSRLRINVLDVREERWDSVYDKAAYGMDVDQVLFPSYDDGQEDYVVVGFQMNQNEKKVCVYEFSEYGLQEMMQEPYSALALMDIDGGGEDELLLLNCTSDHTAKVIKYMTGSFVSQYETGMDTSVTEYTSITRSVQNGGVYIYVDGRRGTDQIGTEILKISGRGLVNLTGSTGNRLPILPRRAGLPSQDVDGDGVVEIPQEQPMPGYANVSDTEKEMQNVWVTVNENEDDYQQQFISYYNSKDGYNFIFPQKWEEKVTVTRELDTNEVTFFEYQGNLSMDDRELLRLKTQSQASATVDQESGYLALTSRGKTTYLVKLAQTSSALAITLEMVSNNLQILNAG